MALTVGILPAANPMTTILPRQASARIARVKNITAQRVQDNVGAPAPVNLIDLLAQPIMQVISAEVDYCLGPGAEYEFSPILPGDSRKRPGAHNFCQLHGCMAHTTRCAEDKCDLAFLQRARSLRATQAVSYTSASAAASRVRHAIRKTITLLCGNRYLFRITTLLRHGQDPVTDLASVHPVTCCRYYPGRGFTGYEWTFRTELIFSRNHQQVHIVDRGCLDVYEYLIRPR